MYETLASTCSLVHACAFCRSVTPVTQHEILFAFRGSGVDETARRSGEWAARLWSTSCPLLLHVHTCAFAVMLRQNTQVWTRLASVHGAKIQNNIIEVRFLWFQWNIESNIAENIVRKARSSRHGYIYWGLKRLDLVTFGLNMKSHRKHSCEIWWIIWRGHRTWNHGECRRQNTYVDCSSRGWRVARISEWNEVFWISSCIFGLRLQMFGNYKAYPYLHNGTVGNTERCRTRAYVSFSAQKLIILQDSIK
jgi:hypothetical protein